MTLDQILALIQSGGVLTLTVAILFGGFKEVWYWGNQVREREAESLARFVKLEADRDEWKDMALGAITAAKAIAEHNGKAKP